MQQAITTHHLCKSYHDKQIISDLNLTIPSGCVYGFLGPNGAGKSTTMKMILGLTKPTNGSLEVFGQEQNAKNRISILKHVGALIESPSYYGHLNAYENLEIIAALKQANKNQISHLLEMVDLKDAQKQKVKQYSLGMKQRLGIAAALLGNPKLLLLDEPTNGLDPSGILEIRELIRSLPEKYGITVLVSSHLLSEIDQMATEIGIIQHGKLVFQNSLHVLHSYSDEKLCLKTNKDEAAYHILKQTSLPIERSKAGLLLPSLNDTDISNIIRMLVQNDIPITRVEEVKKSLEEIFLDIMKETEDIVC